MFCSYCGHEIPEQGNFCLYCGHKLTEMSGETTESKLKPQTGQSLKDAVRKDSKEKKQNQYICIDYTVSLGIDLLTTHEVQAMKNRHYKDGKFVFPIGNYEVAYDETVITAINTARYFGFVRDQTLSFCEDAYKEKIRGWESFIEGAPELYLECMEMISERTVLFLRASGIMSITKDNVRECILLIMQENSEFMKVMLSCAQQYEEVMENYTSAEYARELRNALSGGGGYIGGGFGFAGMMGGMAAAGIANAGSGLVKGIKNSVAKSSNKTKMQKALNRISGDPAILDSLLDDIYQGVSNAALFYREACEKECHIQIQSYYSTEKERLAEDTRKYVQDAETVKKNLSEVLCENPGNRNALLCLVDHFYGQPEIERQIVALSGFLLYEKEVKRHLYELKREEFDKILAMPESTGEEISKKIGAISEKMNFLPPNEAVTETGRLQKLLVQVQEEEQIRQEEKRALDELAVTRSASAKKVDTAFAQNDMNAVGKMGMDGDIVAEERYIQYYIGKIRNENDTRLFDAIASQCGKNRAYDCIIGICCNEGHGTLQDDDAARELLEKSARQGCTYAAGYIGHFLTTGKKTFLEENRAKKYYQSALETLSPYSCMWEGKHLCQGTAEGGANNVPNDYDKALFYLEFAYKCGIEGAEEPYDYLLKHTAEEINAKKYTSDSGCYITTAVCNSFGKSDDCYELSLFRKFRDGYLRKAEDGEKLIAEYYSVAPEIVRRIDMLPERDEIYFGIWERYLSKCVECIQNKELEICKSLYVEMVKRLEKLYL